MSMLVDHSYGRSLIRLFKVTRRGDRHDLSDLSVGVRLEGDFEEAYVDGDNERILPTEAIRNTVQALAVAHRLDPIEAFGLKLAEHFLIHHPQISRIRVDLAEQRWNRLPLGGRQQGHAFVEGGRERRTAAVTHNGERIAVVAGIDQLPILKTAGVTFDGYLADRFTSPVSPADLVLAATLSARWTYSQTEITFGPYWQGVRQLLLESFVQHASRSLQHTLFAMADAVLTSYEEIAEITLELPSQEYRPVDLAQFGIQDSGGVFLPVPDPDSVVRATVTRDTRVTF